MDGPAAFRTLLIDVTDYFDRAPRGASLETLQKFGVPSGTLFSNCLRSFGVVVASTVDKGGPLTPSSEMGMELIRIRTAQQYPMPISTLFPGNLATRERPYDSLATLWTVFAHLKHNTSPTIDGDVFASVPQSSSSHAHSPSGSPITSPHRKTRRTVGDRMPPTAFLTSHKPNLAKIHSPLTTAFGRSKTATIRYFSMLAGRASWLVEENKNKKTKPTCTVSEAVTRT